MRNFSDKMVERIKTQISCLVNVFPENRAVYEIMLKNIVTAGPVTCDNITHAHWMLQKHIQNM